MKSYKEAVFSYFQENPNANIYDCCLALQISYSTVEKWKKAYFAQAGIVTPSKQQIVIDYLNNHKNPKIMQTCMDLKLSYQTVKKYWDIYYGIEKQLPDKIDETEEMVDYEDISLDEDDDEQNVERSYCKGAGLRNCFGISLKTIPLDPKLGDKYTARLSNVFPRTAIFSLQENTYMIFINEKEAEGLVGALKELRADKWFMDVTEKFVINNFIDKEKYYMK